MLFNKQNILKINSIFITLVLFISLFFTLPYSNWSMIKNFQYYIIMIIKMIQYSNYFGMKILCLFMLTVFAFPLYFSMRKNRSRKFKIYSLIELILSFLYLTLFIIEFITHYFVVALFLLLFMVSLVVFIYKKPKKLSDDVYKMRKKLIKINTFLVLLTIILLLCFRIPFGNSSYISLLIQIIVYMFYLISTIFTSKSMFIFIIYLIVIILGILLFIASLRGERKKTFIYTIIYTFFTIIFQFLILISYKNSFLIFSILLLIAGVVQIIMLNEKPKLVPIKNT